MCRECNKRRWDKKLQAYENLSKEFGFIDEYNYGHGWWSDLETQARIISREQAWKSLGFHSAWLPNYTFLPSVAKAMGNRLAELPNLGMTTVLKLQSMPENANEEFIKTYERLYNDKESWVWEHVEKNFKRVEKNRRKYESKSFKNRRN